MGSSPLKGSPSYGNHSRREKAGSICQGTGWFATHAVSQGCAITGVMCGRSVRSPASKSAMWRACVASSCRLKPKPILPPSSRTRVTSASCPEARRIDWVWMYDGLMRVILMAFAAAVIASLSSINTQAQDAWPSKPVRFIVPSSPGGGTDLYARILAQALGDSLKQQFIVDNRPGASGNVGAAVAAKSAPDGYTFLISANPALTVNPSLYRNLPYNAERDFTAATRGGIGPLVLIVHPS